MCALHLGRLGILSKPFLSNARLHACVLQNQPLSSSSSHVGCYVEWIGGSQGQKSVLRVRSKNDRKLKTDIQRDYGWDGVGTITTQFLFSNKNRNIVLSIFQREYFMQTVNYASFAVILKRSCYLKIF